MKKFLMLSMLVCGAVSGAWGATYNCQVQDIGMFSFKSSNEYLFVNTADYNHSNGKALVCGHMGANGCDNGTKVFVTGHHYHAGNARTDSWFYECSSKGANSWDAIGSTGLQKCSSTKGMRVITTVGSNDIYVPESAYTEYVSSGYYVSDKMCFYPHATTNTGNEGDATVVKCDGKYNVGDRLPLDLEQCKKDYSFQKSVAHITKCEKKCNENGSWTHFITECEDGWELDTTGIQRICVEKEKQNNTNPGPSAFEKCLASRTTDEGKACCHLPNAVATWDGQHCNCVGGLDFKIENGRGQCSAKQQDSTKPFKCDAGVLTMLDGWIVSCKDKPTIIATINQIKTLCASDTVTADGFNVLWTALLALNPGECGVQQQLPQPPKPDDDSGKLRASLRIITDAHGTLNGISNGFKASVWKDEEGNFNTARLVSDSVAGVVLGTTGALVTSHVVKKNQVESGFEDIKCTIGGQVVADWGDQFRVGIQ